MIGLLLILRASGAAAAAHRWEVTVAVRVADAAGKDVRVRLAVPVDGPGRQIEGLEVVGRGLKYETVRDGADAHVLFRGRVATSRRLAVTFQVESRTDDMRLVPDVVPVHDPSADLLQHLMPARLFQSRSILVREFLETHVGPLLARRDEGLLDAVFEATRQELTWHRGGKSLALDVIRRRHGNRIGIERAFTTFLRCARVPARFVEGIDLASRTRWKRVFWTEVWAAGRWWPVSASRGWIGEMPPSYVALARDGSRVVEVDKGPATVSYTVVTRRLGDGT